MVNLISARRPDQQKLVGRITIDLLKVMKKEYYNELERHKLDYCSVNANVKFSMKFMGKRISNILP